MTFETKFHAIRKETPKMRQFQAFPAIALNCRDRISSICNKRWVPRRNKELCTFSFNFYVFFLPFHEMKFGKSSFWIKSTIFCLFMETCEFPQAKLNFCKSVVTFGLNWPIWKKIMKNEWKSLFLLNFACAKGGRFKSKLKSWFIKNIKSFHRFGLWICFSVSIAVPLRIHRISLSILVVPLFIHEFNLFIRICLSFLMFAFFCFIQKNPCRFEFDILLPLYICFFYARFTSHWREYETALQRIRIKIPFIYLWSKVDKSTESRVLVWFVHV